MQTTAYSRVSVPVQYAAELRQMATEWVVGSGRFTRSRSSRLKLGLNESIRPGDLLAGGDFGDPSALTIRVRIPADSVWLMHWVHADQGNPRARWHNVVRIEQRGARAYLDQISARRTDDGSRVAPIGAASQLMKEVVQQFRAEIHPPNTITTSAADVTGPDVAQFVRYFLLDTDRETPVVVVSPRNVDGRAVVAADDLARRLAGCAAVIRLRSVSDAYAWTEALSRSGFDEQFGCYDGAIRVYHPALRPTDSPYAHRLILRHRVESLDWNARSERIAGVLVEDIAGPNAQGLLLDAVELLDREQWRNRALYLTEAVPEPVVDEGTPTHDLETEVHRLRGRIEDLQTELKAALAMQEYFDKEHRIEAEKANQQAIRIAELEQQAAASEQRAVEANNVDSVAAALRLVSSAHPERFEVLDSAWKSARASPFSKPNDVVEALNTLAIIVAADLDPAETLGKVMGLRRAKWRPKDHDTTIKQQRLKDARTYTCGDGVRRLFETHITLGGGQDARSCMQVYYRTLPNKRLELGWVGKHHDTASTRK